MTTIIGGAHAFQWDSINLSVTNLSATNLTTVTFTPTNVNTSGLVTATNASLTNASLTNATAVNISSVSNYSTTQSCFALEAEDVRLFNSTNVSMSNIIRDGNELRFIGNTSDHVNADTDIYFYTNDGLSGNPKLRINKADNVVTVLDLDVTGLLNVSNVALTNVNASIINSSEATIGILHTPIINISDINASDIEVDTFDAALTNITTNNASTSNSSTSNSSTANVSYMRLYSDATKSVQFQKAGNVLNVIGNPDGLGAGSDTEMRFFTNSGTGAPKLTIRSADDKIQAGDIELTGFIEAVNVSSDNSSFTNASIVTQDSTTINTSNMNASVYNSSLEVGLGNPFVTDTMVLSHPNCANQTEYGFSQDTNGFTHINSSVDVALRIGNIDKLNVNQHGKVFVADELNAPLINCSTTNVSTANSSTANVSNMNASVYNSSLEVGLASPFVADTMVLSHKNCANQIEYGFSQDTDGYTHMNSSVEISLRIDDVDKLHINQYGKVFVIDELNAPLINCSTTNVSAANSSTVNTSTFNASAFVISTFNTSTLNSSYVYTKNISIEQYGSALLGNATCNQVMLDNKSGNENLLSFWDVYGGGGSILYPAWKTDSGTYDDVNFLNMVAYHNDGTPANRNISFVVPINTSSVINASTINVSLHNVSSINASDIDVDTFNAGLANASTVNASNVSANIFGNLLAGTNITLVEEASGKTTISSSGGGGGSSSLDDSYLQSITDGDDPMISITTQPVTIQKNGSVDPIFEIMNSTDTKSLIISTENCDINTSGHINSSSTINCSMDITGAEFFQSAVQNVSGASLTRKDYVDTQVALNTAIGVANDAAITALQTGKQDTLTTATDLIGQSLNVSIDQNERCVLGKATVGMVGFTDFAGFCHNDMYNGSGTYALLQNSVGNTFLNAATSRSIYLRIANSDALVIDDTKDVTIKEDLKVEGTLDHKANIYTRTCDGTPTAPSGTIYYPDYNVAGFNGNANIYGTWTTPSATSTTGLQVLKTGYYRIEAKMNWHTVTYLDRYQVWSRVLINNVAVDESADFCYGRHKNYILYATNTINIVVSLTANDWVKFDSNLCKNSAVFGASWDTGGVIDRFGFDCFSITYLGV